MFTMLYSVVCHRANRLMSWQTPSGKTTAILLSSIVPRELARRLAWEKCISYISTCRRAPSLWVGHSTTIFRWSSHDTWRIKLKSGTALTCTGSGFPGSPPRTTSINHTDSFHNARCVLSVKKMKWLSLDPCLTFFQFFHKPVSDNQSRCWSSRHQLRRHERRPPRYQVITLIKFE